MLEKPTEEMKRYALMGMAAMLPGMELALEVLQRQIAEMRAALTELQDEGHAALYAATKKSLKAATHVKDGRGGWPADPEARKREMARRRAAKVKGRKLSEAGKSTWAAMTARQRKARLAAMAAGRQKNQHQEAA